MPDRITDEALDCAAAEGVRHQTITLAIEKQLRAYRIFVADLNFDRRLLERIDASIMQTLYSQPSPCSDILDKGMHYSARREHEEPITVTNVCSAKLIVKRQSRV